MKRPKAKPPAVLKEETSLPEGPEAREWMTVNQQGGMFAGNRFDDMASAITFVEQLYALGATRVIIPRDSIDDRPERIAQDGGPGADAMIVFLPDDQNQRKQLLQMINREIDAEGYAPEDDVGQPWVFLWWD